MSQGPTTTTTTSSASQSSPLVGSAADSSSTSNETGIKRIAFYQWQKVSEKKRTVARDGGKYIETHGLFRKMYLAPPVDGMILKCTDGGKTRWRKLGQRDEVHLVKRVAVTDPLRAVKQASPGLSAPTQSLCLSGGKKRRRSPFSG